MNPSALSYDDLLEELEHNQRVSALLRGELVARKDWVRLHFLPSDEQRFKVLVGSVLSVEEASGFEPSEGGYWEGFLFTLADGVTYAAKRYLSPERHCVSPAGRCGGVTLDINWEPLAFEERRSPHEAPCCVASLLLRHALGHKAL